MDTVARQESTHSVSFGSRTAEARWRTDRGYCVTRHNQPGVEIPESDELHAPYDF